MDFPTSFSKCSSFLLYFPIITAVTCIVIHYLVFCRRMSQWRKVNIPFLKPSFLIGQKYFLTLLTGESFLVAMDRIYKENSDKDVVGFFGWIMPMIMVRNPAVIRQVYSKNYDKTFEMGIAGAKTEPVFLHTPTLTVDKALWQANRKALTPLLAINRMSNETFAKITKQIGSMWAYAEKAHRERKPIDVTQVSQHFMMDGTSHSLFGLEANSYKKQGELLKMMTELWPKQDTAFEIFDIYAQLRFVDVKFLQNRGYYTKQQRALIADFISRAIEHKKQQGGNEDDLVDHLMRHDDGEGGAKQDSKVNITDRMLGLTFTVAAGAHLGQTTMGIFTIHLLSLHPEHQDRIRQEVTKAMEKHETSEFTYDVVRDLHFTEQCLLESLRLYPIQVTMTKVCSEDFKVLGTDYTIKKGERVLICPYSVQHDPRYFKNPEKFDPDRFSAENLNTISPDTIFSFGFTPRKCLGDKISLLMGKTLIGSLLHKFKIIPRSHVKQMDVNDIENKRFSIRPKMDVLVDIVPW